MPTSRRNVDRQVKRHALEIPVPRRSIATRSRKASLGTPEEYRKYLMEQFRRQRRTTRCSASCKQDGKIIPVNVTDAEIAAEFERAKQFLGPKPAIGHVQADRHRAAADAAAKEVARVKAESLLVQTEGRRRLRANGQARIDGSADEGHRRRSRLASSR